MLNVNVNSDDPYRWMKGLFGGLLMSGLILGLIMPVSAQGSMRLQVGGLEIKNFPRLVFYLDATDEQGRILEGLAPEDLTLVEDGQTLPVAGLELIEPGLQFTVALNLDAALESPIGDVSRFELARQALQNWAAEAPAAAPDDLSLAVNNGQQINHAASLDEWLVALNGLQPDLKALQGDLSALTRAVGLAADPTQHPRAKRAVLYITPPMTGSETGLAELAGRADQMDVRIFVWVVTAADRPAPDVALLQALVDRTGGRLALVSGPETFPNLEEWLAPLRQQYQVSYVSGLRAGGQHALEVLLQQEGSTVAQAEPLTFALDIAPPNPIFLSPPAEVQRAWTEKTSEQPSGLQPVTLDLQIVVEFSDGVQRALLSTRLFLDGELVAENTAEPFERFTLDLTGFAESGPHTLRVEATDELELSGSSIELPLVVLVEPKPGTAVLGGISTTGLIAIGAVLVAGLVLAGVLVGESRLRKQGGLGFRRRRDPLTEPVTIEQGEPRRRSAARETVSKPRLRDSGSAPARLVRLNENEQPVAGEMIPLSQPELTLGSDSAQAMLAIRDATVDKLHARILCGDEGGFRLMDQGSVAGTWVNYALVSGTGALLKHGDLVHIGRALYRFELANPPARRELVATLLEEK